MSRRTTMPAGSYDRAINKCGFYHLILSQVRAVLTVSCPLDRLQMLIAAFQVETIELDELRWSSLARWNAIRQRRSQVGYRYPVLGQSAVHRHIANAVMSALPRPALPNSERRSTQHNPVARHMWMPLLLCILRGSCCSSNSLCAHRFLVNRICGRSCALCVARRLFFQAWDTLAYRLHHLSEMQAHEVSASSYNHLRRYADL